jgi:hypothetical protein
VQVVALVEEGALIEIEATAALPAMGAPAPSAPGGTVVPARPGGRG